MTRVAEIYVQYMMQDKASQEVNRIANNLNKLRTGADKTTKTTKTTNNQIEKLNKNLDKTGKTSANTGRKLTAVAESAFVVGMGVGMVNMQLKSFIDSTIQATEEFTKSYALFIAKTDTLIEQHKVLEESIGEVWGPSDTAQAMERWAAAGFDVSKNLDVVTWSLKIAAIEGENFKTISDNLAGALKATGTELDDFDEFVDAMAQASKISKAEISDIALAVGHFGSISKASGMTIQETLALEAMAFDRLGNRSGRALRALMIAFESSKLVGTESATSLVKALEILRNKFGDNTTAIKEYANQIGLTNVEYNIFLSLMQVSENEWKRVRDEINETGAAQRMFEIATANLGSELDRLRSNLDVLKITIGSGFIPVITTISNITEKLSSAFNTENQSVGKLAGSFLYLASALGSAATIYFMYMGISAAMITFSNINKQKINEEIRSRVLLNVQEHNSAVLRGELNKQTINSVMAEKMITDAIKSHALAMTALKVSMVSMFVTTSLYTLAWGTDMEDMAYWALQSANAVIILASAITVLKAALVPGLGWASALKSVAPILAIGGIGGVQMASMRRMNTSDLSPESAFGVSGGNSNMIQPSTFAQSTVRTNAPYGSKAYDNGSNMNDNKLTVVFQNPVVRNDDDLVEIEKVAFRSFYRAYKSAGYV